MGLIELKCPLGGPPKTCFVNQIRSVHFCSTFLSNHMLSAISYIKLRRLFTFKSNSDWYFSPLSLYRYNGSLPSGDRGRRRSRFALYKRAKANGVKPSTVHILNNPQSSKVTQQFSTPLLGGGPCPPVEAEFVNWHNMVTRASLVAAFVSFL